MRHRLRLRRAAACIVLGLMGGAASNACGNSGSGNAPVNPGGGGEDATADVQQEAAGDDGTAPTGDGGGTDSHADSSASTDSAAANDATGDVQDSGITFSDVFVDAPLDLPCGASARWGTPVQVLTTPAADATIFSGITPDALSIAWTSTTGGTVTAWIADRASTTVAFGAPQALSSSFGALAFDRVSLSGDGLRVVGVRADTAGFVAATRAARPGTFDTDDSAEFAVFDSPDAAGSTYASPLLSPDNQLFVYLLTSSSSDDDLYLSSRAGWVKQQAETQPQLARVNGQQRRPTGMTLDELTLFYWDEVSGSEKVAYGAPFSLFGDLGNWQNAAPTGDCSGIYYSAPAAGGAITIYSVGPGNM